MTRFSVKPRFLLLFFFFALLVGTSEASDLLELDINVLLNSDGSAKITQTWRADVYGKGTEFYVIQDNLGDMEISNFSVKDDTGAVYTNEGTHWNTQRSRSEKTRRCGMVRTSSGFELCWGQGKEGPRTYTVSWTFSHLVKAYKDFDGFNVRLLNDEMSPAPQRLHVVLEKPGRPFAHGEVDLWAFGFQGTVILSEGKVVAESDSPLGPKNYANVMLRFKKGIFSPKSIVQSKFKDLEEQALEGAEDGETYNEFREAVFPLLLSAGFTILILVLSFFRNKGNRVQSAPFANLSPEFIKGLHDAPYCRSIPCGGNLPAAYVGMSAMPTAPKLQDLVGAYFLRWVKVGALKPVQAGLDAPVELKVVSNSGGPAENNALFGLLQEAAGHDGILQKNEFASWGARSENRGALLAWTESEKKAGLSYFRDNGSSETRETTSFWVRYWIFGKRRPFEASFLTSAGEHTLLELAGFKKYLQDFTLINERRVVEVELWDEYLVFATLYGIGKQVSRELLALYPEFAAQSAILRPDVPVTVFLDLSDSFAASLLKSQSSSYNSSSGGPSFRIGGGGFSGGGSGGGER